VAIVDQGRKVEVAAPDDLTARGTDTVDVGIADPPATAPQFTHEGIVDARMEDGRLIVTARGSGSVIPDLLRELDRMGHEVTDIDIRRASLEEVFVDMTRQEGAVQQ
jgi:ABC-2 type transport system ATP-binding protein